MSDYKFNEKIFYNINIQQIFLIIICQLILFLESYTAFNYDTTHHCIQAQFSEEMFETGRDFNHSCERNLLKFEDFIVLLKVLFGNEYP